MQATSARAASRSSYAQHDGRRGGPADARAACRLAGGGRRDRPKGAMVVGMLTDRDIVTAIVAKVVDPSIVSVGEAMSARRRDGARGRFDHRPAGRECAARACDAFPSSTQGARWSDWWRWTICSRSSRRSSIWWSTRCAAAASTNRWHDHEGIDRWHAQRTTGTSNEARDSHASQRQKACRAVPPEPK